MLTNKQLKQAEKSALQQRQIVAELTTLVRDIERCEKTINDLQRELMQANAKYPSPRTTRDDIAYLTDLLKCAHKKLAWEKTIASLQKRIPVTLEKLSAAMNDAGNPPPDEIRAAMLQGLQGVQAAMERLQNVKAM